MIKTSLAFLAGTVFATAIVILGAGRPAAMIGLGFLLTAAIASGVLWLTGLRRLARFLNAFADGLNVAQEAQEPKQRTRPTPIDRSGYVKPSAKKRDMILTDTISEYLGDDDLFGASAKSAERKAN
jgi:hypothetical protein